MQISRKGAERYRGSKHAKIQRSDLSIWEFDGHNIITLEFTPSFGFDADCTHDYRVEMRVDEFADLIVKLDRSARICDLKGKSREMIDNLVEKLTSLSATLESKG